MNTQDSVEYEVETRCFGRGVRKREVKELSSDHSPGDFFQSLSFKDYGKLLTPIFMSFAQTTLPNFTLLCLAA